jgi:GH35 family endo-1,4-beta-xylanase
LPSIGLALFVTCCGPGRANPNNRSSGGTGNVSNGGAAGSGIAGVGGGGVGGAGGSPAKTGLSSHGANIHRLIGAAVDVAALGSDATYAAVLAQEFDYLTPENATKWGPLEPSPDGYQWTGGDAIVDFARANAQQVKGHTFVWHNQLPAWVNDTLTAAELSAALKSHIETTLDHFDGKMRAWDVINEAIDTSTLTGTASGLRDTIFLQKLGTAYLEDAFRWARAAAPDVLLFYNDFGIEGIGTKSDRALALMQDLLSKGVPIDGIGIQAHFSTAAYPSEESLRANIERFAALGLRVNISELDVFTDEVPGDEATRLAAERVVYQQAVGVCATEPGCEAITLWGFTDKYSWRNTPERPDLPLPFDATYGKKPAYDGIVAGLSGILPSRGPNLVVNPDFESGDAPWTVTGGTLTVGSSNAHSGSSACLGNRANATDGLAQSLLAQLSLGGQLSLSAWVRISGAPTATVRVVVAVEETGGQVRELRPVQGIATDSTWIELRGDRGLGFSATPTRVDLVVDADADVEVCVDDVSVQVVTAP